MKFIYAKRPQPQIEFGTTSQLDAVPSDAEVLAVCDGALTIRGQTHCVVADKPGTLNP